MWLLQILFDPTTTKKKKKKKKPFMLDEEGDGVSEETQQAEPREAEPEAGEEREVEPEEEEGKKKGANAICYRHPASFKKCSFSSCLY